MKTHRFDACTLAIPTRRDGFTLTDLVVTLGVITVLGLVGAPVLAGGKRQTDLGVCANHVRQLVLACQVYANDNNSRLPVLDSTSGAAWAWDLPTLATAVLMKAGITTNIFYCPGTAPRFTDRQNWQDPGLATTGTPANLWTFGSSAGMAGAGGFHLIGYAMAFSGTTSLLNATNQNTTILPEPVTINSVTVTLPANQRVLVADANLSSSASVPGYAHPENNYTSIMGGFYKPHVSPHLKGNVPAGGNVGFKDGHVEWRRFEVMTPRTVFSASATFWW